MLVMYAVGALLVVEHMLLPAMAVGGGVAVLLQFKPELHGIARKLGDDDLRAIMQFVLITCIILPVLPNRTYGPLDVLNPFETWLMVVLIVGMSLGGYIVYKFFGRDAGILLGGMLGGAISSTATTVSYARGARDDPAAARSAAIVIMIASTVMYLRVLVAVAVVSGDPPFLARVAPPVVILMALDARAGARAVVPRPPRAGADARAEEPHATEVGRRVRRDVRRRAVGLGRGEAILGDQGLLRWPACRA